MNSPLAYIGGKSKLSETIIKMVPEHKTYCEVFAGAAWVFFRKEPSRYETINDLDSDLIIFYRVLQNHVEEFLRQFKWLLSSREWFEDWKRQQEAGGLTDIQRAARYYYLQRVVIENLPWQKFTRRYDRIDTLFYIDPPYYKAPYYQHNLKLEDYREMAEILDGIKAKFILSINDHPEMRDIFKSFRIKPVTLKYTVAKAEQKTGRELIITNY